MIDLERQLTVEDYLKSDGPHPGCGCTLRGPTYLYVGKAVKLRNRCQGYPFPTLMRPPVDWFFKYTEPPHDHWPILSVWFVHKSLISVAEANLIAHYKPIHNTQEKDGTFADFSLWPIRPPDIHGLDITEFEPRRPEPEGLQLKNEPGVYVWWTDPGASLMFFSTLFDHIESPEIRERKLLFQRKLLSLRGELS